MNTTGINWEKFDKFQTEQIREGIKKGLDVSSYANPEFDDEQMEQIRRGLEEDLDVSSYAKPEFGWEQMFQIRKGLEKGLDVSYYANPEFTWEQMHEIRIKPTKNKFDRKRLYLIYGIITALLEIAIICFWVYIRITNPDKSVWDLIVASKLRTAILTIGFSGLHYMTVSFLRRSGR